MLSGAHVTAPPLVANYIERPEAIRALRDCLFAENHRTPIALTAIAGMGGIGKTVLAGALIRDNVVQQAFPDGIVWITVGREKQQDFVQQMKEIAKALGDDLSRYDNPVSCQNQYKTTIAKKAALIVVDDVWSKADFVALLAESPRSRFLFTTRDASIANFVGARKHQADLLDLAQSRELLGLWANLPVEQLPPEADEIIRECGQLPLALSQIGAMLRDQTPAIWGDTLGLLRNLDLSAMQEQLPIGQDYFFRAVEVSFLALTPRMQEKYKALAVLLEDMPAPVQILQPLWKTSEAEARLTSKHFVDRSLAQREPDGENIRLHDLQLDYVRFQYPDKEALRLIRSAVRLSSHVIADDPTQFAGQIAGRLMSHAKQASVQCFVRDMVASAPRPWLRSQWPSLDQAGGNLLRTLQGHSSSVLSVAVTPDGRRAVSASADHTLKVWDLDSGQSLLTLQGHSHPVRGVAVTPDGRCAVSASADHTLKVWDLDSGQPLFTFQGHSAEVNDVAVTPDGRCAVSASDDNTLKVWDLDSGQPLFTFQGHSAEVNDVAVTPGGRCAVSASDDSTLKVWNLESSQPISILQGHSGGIHGGVHSVAITPDGKRAISGSWDRTLKVWDLDSGQPLFSPFSLAYFGYFGRVSSVAVTPDGRLTVSGGSTLTVWDHDTGQELHTLRGHVESVHGVAITPDSKRAVSASADRTLMVWDLHSGQRLLILLGHSAAVNGVAVTPDGRCAVSASDDRMLKVWDLSSGQPLLTLQGHSSWVTGVAVTPDGRRAVSASGDGTLKVWDLHSSQHLLTLQGHSGGVHGVAVARDGKSAASVSDDNMVKVWDLESGQALATFALEGRGLCCAFVSNTTIVAGDGGGRIYLLSLEE